MITSKLENRTGKSRDRIESQCSEHEARAGEIESEDRGVERASRYQRIPSLFSRL